MYEGIHKAKAVPFLTVVDPSRLRTRRIVSFDSQRKFCTVSSCDISSSFASVSSSSSSDDSSSSFSSLSLSSVVSVLSSVFPSLSFSSVSVSSAFTIF